MDKPIWRTVTITIIETWTITWADGAEQTVVYQARQPGQMLPASPNEAQGWTALTTVETNSSLCAPVAQTGSSETTDRTG
jgi:hypothetical protein